MKNYSDIIVDEISMLHPKWFGILYQQLLANPDLCITLAGDMVQTTPIQERNDPYNIIDYANSAIVHHLCDGNRCDLPYLEGEKARYDRITKEKLDTLRETGMIDISDKKLHDDVRYTICIEPQTRTLMNQIKFKHYSEGKTLVRIGQFDWYEGMPVIAHSTKYGSEVREIRNAVRYTIAAIHKNEISLSRVDEVLAEGAKPFILTIAHTAFASHFRYGWVETVRRWQGGKIEEPFNIIIEPRATLNELYTAIGRTTKWEHVGITRWDKPGTKPEGKDHKYLRTAYTFKCRASGPMATMQRGFIYQWRTADGAPFYVGRTNNMERRENEHRESPTNPEMTIMMKNPTNVMVAIEGWNCTTQQLDERETLCIRRAQLAGAKLLNVKKLADEIVPTILQSVVAVDAPRIIRFEPRWDEKRERYRIQWTDTDGSKKERQWSGKVDKVEALQLANAFRAQLIKEYFGLVPAPPAPSAYQRELAKLTEDRDEDFA